MGHTDALNDDGLREESPIGMASFVIGIVSLLIVALVFILVTLNPIVWQDGMIIGPMLCTALPYTASIVGLGLGIGAATQKGRKRANAIRGIVLNAIVVMIPIAGYILVMLIR